MKNIDFLPDVFTDSITYDFSIYPSSQLQDHQPKLDAQVWYQHNDVIPQEDWDVTDPSEWKHDCI